MAGTMIVTQGSPAEIADLEQAFAGQALVALDCEGVDLSRSPGRVTITQLSTPTHCFILDLLEKERNHPLVNWLRSLLEDKSVEKIIHDCRMDSDALKHNLEIELINVHDTSSWEKEMGNPNKSLNNVLEKYRLAQNVNRDSSVYDANHAFWATRPLTNEMISWAGCKSTQPVSFLECITLTCCTACGITHNDSESLFLWLQSATSSLSSVFESARFRPYLVPTMLARRLPRK